MSVMMQAVATLLGQEESEIDESFVMIAQYELQGIAPAIIADTFAVEEEEIQEILKNENYQNIKQAVALELAKFSSDADTSWDSLEHRALKNLQRVVQTCPDPEFQLKVAVMANKANRRHRQSNQPDVLNPAGVGTRVQLTLTERFVEKLGKGRESITERRIDIENSEACKMDNKALDRLLNPSINPLAVA